MSSAFYEQIIKIFNVFERLFMQCFFRGLIVLCFSIQVLFGKDISEIDFFDAMQRTIDYDEWYMKGNEQWRFMETLFKDYQKDQLHESKNYIIPPLIHFIWLGSSLPIRSQVMIETWKRFHTDWIIKIWTEADLKWFPMKNREIFDHAKNFGEKADIWRYEILLRYGGLYVDCDFECLKSFNHMHKSCEFYAGLYHGRDPELANGLIGCIPGHPILKLCVDSLKMSSSTDDVSGRIISQTGPAHFTRCFWTIARLSKKGLVPFPAAFFYAFPYHSRNATRDRSLIKSTWILPESYALHYWDVSWLANGAELMQK